MLLGKLNQAVTVVGLVMFCDEVVSKGEALESLSPENESEVLA